MFMKKKILSLALALVMTLALATSAFAADTFTITGPMGEVYEVTNFVSQTKVTVGSVEVPLIVCSGNTVITLRCDTGFTSMRFWLIPDGNIEDWRHARTAPSNYVSHFHEYGKGVATILQPGTYTVTNNFDHTIMFIKQEAGNAPEPTTPAPAQTSSDIQVTLNGTRVEFDQPPIIQNGRTLVPLRAIFEAMGATIDWNGNTQTVTAVRQGVTVIMTIGNNVFTVNGEQKTLDVAPQIIGGRTLVPARAVAEGFGASVDWNANTQTVIITE